MLLPLQDVYKFKILIAQHIVLVRIGGIVQQESPAIGQQREVAVLVLPDSFINARQINVLYLYKRHHNLCEAASAMCDE